MEKKGTYTRLEQKKPLVAGNRTYPCADDFRLTTFDLDTAHRELHETEEIRIKSLKKLKEMLTKDATVVYCTDDDFLLRYLRVAKFDSEKARKAVKKFYNVKIKYPDLVALSPQLEEFLQHNFIRRLPYKDEDGCFLFWLKLKNWETEKMSFREMMQLNFSTLDILTMNPCLQINGVIAFQDYQLFTTSQVTQVLYPRNLMLLAEVLQNFRGNHFHKVKAMKEYSNVQTYFCCALVKSANRGLEFAEIYPWRVKRIILLNFNSALRAVYRAVRPFLKKKIAERIVMIGSDLAELHQYVNPLLLPKEYGGYLEEEECSVTRLVMDNLHYLEYQRSFGAVTEK